ncbi:MAG: hypothetical protein QN178_07520 [Armatimonadota bacterium]|nr:hypothetical protein [Armatimonadota bacterium]
MIGHGAGPTRPSQVPVRPRAAVLSFTFGLLALRVCWLPGVNCLMAMAAVALGALALARVARQHGARAGVEEAVTGLVLGMIVLGLSVFFVSALVAAYR